MINIQVEMLEKMREEQGILMKEGRLIKQK